MSEAKATGVGDIFLFSFYSLNDVDTTRKGGKVRGEEVSIDCRTTAKTQS